MDLYPQLVRSWLLLSQGRGRCPVARILTLISWLDHGHSVHLKRGTRTDRSDSDRKHEYIRNKQIGLSLRLSFLFTVALFFIFFMTFRKLSSRIWWGDVQYSSTSYFELVSTKYRLIKRFLSLSKIQLNKTKGMGYLPVLGCCSKRKYRLKTTGITSIFFVPLALQR